MSVLRAANLWKSYQRRAVVKDVSVSLSQGEIVGLLGPNGAGKTTTFYLITGLIRPDQGQVFLNEDDITSQPMYKRARRGIGYLAQEPSIFRRMTVEENILAILETLALSKSDRLARLEFMLSELGLTVASRLRARSPGNRCSCSLTNRSPGSIRSPFTTSR
jgi:lipopolysaccharide export system ATP-binding protein